MKKITTFLICLFGISNAFALTCADIRTDLSRTQENASVLTLQKFLFEKGFLKANPNGYFGPGTIASVKAYQKSIGLSQVGAVGPATRAQIKKESCGTSTVASTQNNTVAVLPTTTAKVTTPVVPVVNTKPKTPAEERNSKRVSDVEILLKGMYDQFLYDRGLVPVPIVDIPVELCVVPQSVLDSNATATVPVLPCAKFADITKISPHRLKTIPRDPSLATSSTLTGYMVTRSSYNDVTVIAKNAEGGITIKATCNFNSSCTDIKRVSSVLYEVPSIASTSRSFLIKDSSLASSFVIYGKNFAATNTVILASSYSNKKYTLGTFSSSDGVTISLQSADLKYAASCGQNCFEAIPADEYDVVITNNGGESNKSHISIKGYTPVTLFIGGYSVKPNTKNNKIASIVLSLPVPVTMKSLTLTATNTKTILLGKINHVTVKDSVTGAVSAFGTSGGTASLARQLTSAGESKAYDFYADVDSMAFSDVGDVAYSGFFTVTDTTTNPLVPMDINLPIKNVIFMVSY